MTFCKVFLSRRIVPLIILIDYFFSNNQVLSSDEFSIDKCHDHAIALEMAAPFTSLQEYDYNNFSTITIGLITSYNQDRFSLGAFRLAVEKVNSNPELLPGRKLKFITADVASPLPDNTTTTDLLTPLPIRIMTKMYNKGAIAYIEGSEDNCYSEALVASAWNLPILSYKCSDIRVSNKKIYTTFARTIPPSSKVFKSVIALLKRFEWTKYVLIISLPDTNGWIQIYESAKTWSKKYNISMTDHFLLHDYIPDRFEEMENIVEKSYEKTRVYVFIGEHITLVDLVKALANRNLLDKGEYIVVSLDDTILDSRKILDYFQPNYLHDNEETEKIIKAFRSVLKLAPSQVPSQKNYSDTLRHFANYSVAAPFCVPYHPFFINDSEVSIVSTYLYDSVMLYAQAVTKVLNESGDPRNGTAIFNAIRNHTYLSIQGHNVLIDENGDAEGNYSLIALFIEEEKFGDTIRLRYKLEPVGHFRQSTNEIPEFHYFNESNPIQWIRGEPPLAEPICGFKGNRCKSDTDWKSIIIGSVFAAVFTVATVLAFRHYRYEQKLACLLWKIDMKDVIMIPSGKPEPLQGTKSTVALCRQLLGNAVDTSTIDAPIDALACKKSYTRIGFYKGTVVAIKPIYKSRIELNNRTIRMELKQIREMRHENILNFIGASVDHQNICILTAYSARGSLSDVLSNTDLHIDNMFLASLVADLIKGMIYLHDSPIISHGSLNSRNCLVDSRWVLTISDFGLNEFKAGQDIRDTEKEQEKLLWTAPELISDPNRGRGTQKGDIYSFGIVLYEMIGRSGPWGKIQYTNQEIIERVVNPKNGNYFRPSTKNLDCGDTILKCLESSWSEIPEDRPDFRYIRVRLKELQAGLKPNIFDNMLNIMEKYASNLEDLVSERTIQLLEEKKKTEALLHRMLPKTVAEALKRGDPVEAESYELVTIYFSDIVGFTELSAVSTPLQVVELLSNLYTLFDSILSDYDVYKVETIGDSYMVVSGLPVIKPHYQHAGEIASMAIHLLERIQSFEIKHRPGERLKLRIGIHSGPVVAGVVGLKMPRYCLFGDTVNTASRMESSGSALRIHISDVTKNLLEALGGYHYEERGIIPIKGKGEMLTYWLTGEDQSTSRRKTTQSVEPTGSDNDEIANRNNINLGFKIGTENKLTMVEEEKDGESNDSNPSSIDKPTTWLLKDKKNDKIASLQIESTGRNGRLVNCSTVFNECKASIIKELHLKKNGNNNNNLHNRYRSAPIVTFIDNNSNPPIFKKESNFV